MTFTKDQVAAVMRHVYTAAGAATAVAVAFGMMAQGDADKVIESMKQIGEGLGVIIGAIGMLLPIINALRAGRSASPAEQVRRVEEQAPGVVVTPVTPEGQKLVEKATGVEKPIETPTAGPAP